MPSIMTTPVAEKSRVAVRKKMAFAWLLLVVSFSGFAEGIHPPSVQSGKGATAHYRIIDTSERADEHISEKVPEFLVKR